MGDMGELLASSSALREAPNEFQEAISPPDDEVPACPQVLNVDESIFVRMFNFRTRAVARNVTLTHHKAVWTIYLDGSWTASETHHPWSIWLGKRFFLNFAVDVPGEASLSAVLTM